MSDPLVALLHGPNLDMLGRRPSAHYGAITLPELEARVRDWGAERGMRVSCFQTNHEGAFIEHVHGLAGAIDGAVVNPGAWTHYQWSIRDAMELLDAPFVEVHLSDVEAREDWRKVSVFDGLVLEKISGKGAEGYREALAVLARELGVSR